MSKHNESDSMIIRDSSDRRRFIRKGAAFMVTAGVIAAGSSRSALASDCDRGGPGGKKPEHGGNGSDSDTGAGADPTGCGKQRSEPPKISKKPGTSERQVARKISVAKIVG